MPHELSLTLLGATGLLGMALVAGVLRERRSPVWMRRLHLLAGAGSLIVLGLAVQAAAHAIPPLPGASGRLPLGFVATALLLGLLLSVVVRRWRQGFTVMVALHVCMGFCGVLLAAAWVLRPGG